MGDNSVPLPSPHSWSRLAEGLSGPQSASHKTHVSVRNLASSSLGKPALPENQGPQEDPETLPGPFHPLSPLICPSGVQVLGAITDITLFPTLNSQLVGRLGVVIDTKLLVTTDAGADAGCLLKSRRVIELGCPVLQQRPGCQEPFQKWLVGLGERIRPGLHWGTRARPLSGLAASRGH